MNRPSFSGGFARQQKFYTDPFQTLHVADPDHFHVGHAEEKELAYTYTAPPAEGLGYDVGETWGSEYVVVSDGGPIDMTPNQHDQGLVSPALYTDLADLTDPGGVEKDKLRRTLPQHAKDQGAVAVATRPRYGALQFSHERYDGARIEGFGPEASEVTETALRRGKNADEQNNPPLSMYQGRGFRYGWTEQSWVDRKLVGQGLNPRVYDARVLTPNLAWTDTNAPPPEEGNPYTSPFPSLARGIQILAQRAQLRRTPSTDAVLDLPLEIDDRQPYAAEASPWWLSSHA